MSEIGPSHIGETPQIRCKSWPSAATVRSDAADRTECNAREVVRLVLERERELAVLERLLGSGAAVKVLAADGVVVRNGELLWAYSALSRLDELCLIAP
jgi:hypothetical protein